MNNGRGLTQLFSALAVLGAVACGAEPPGAEASGEQKLGKSDQPSTQQYCNQVYVQTGADCSSDAECDQGGCIYGPTTCTPTYDYITVCHTQEEPTTPVLVYGSHNPTNLDYQYRTDPGVSTGYVSDGVVFSLANDNYMGGAPFTSLDSGTGYYFPQNTIPYLVPLYEFWNPARSDKFFSLDPNGASSLPCNIYGHPSSGPTVDCYMNTGSIGYVGRPPALLRAGQMLAVNQAVSSYDNRFHLVMQSDGNLVLYQGLQGQSMTALWSSGTWGTSGNRAIMQDDGNFVLYDSSNNALWSSGTWDNPGAYLAVQNDGNVVVYDNSTPLWASNTCCR